MTINQEPTNGNTYFSKAVPDIILTKSGTDTSILLELKKGTDDILTEKYMFDANNSIRIREIVAVLELCYESLFKNNDSLLKTTNTI